MLPVKKPDSRVVYIAGSAREFPESVQDWLSQAKNRAIASTNVYEALARLSGRYRPTAMIVSIDSVDWDELDFFDLAARLSPETTLYITGHEHNQAKLEAAFDRGAKPFDAVDLDADLVRPAPSRQPDTTQDLLAGTLPRVHDRTTSRLGAVAGREFKVASTSTPKPTQQPQKSVIKPVQNDREDSDRKDLQGAKAENRTVDPPAMRLVVPQEAESELKRASDPEISIPFPWAPSPDRPKRTPPSAVRTKPWVGPENTQEHRSDSESESDSKLENGQTSSPGTPVKPPTTHINDPPSVELTSEELAALMGHMVPPNSDSQQEQRS